MARGNRSKPNAGRSKGGRGGKDLSSQRSRVNASTASLARWENEEDIPDDDEDAFHKQRDKLVFGEEDADEDEDQFDALGGGREVLGLKGADEVESEDGEEDEEEEEAYEEEEDERPATLNKAKSKVVAAHAESDSEEEDDDDDDEDEEEQDRGVASEGWGPNKRSYYSTNDLEDLSSDSEMDEEERREMEMREVKRLQAKSRLGMDDDDFGLDEVSKDRMRGTASSREQRRIDLDGVTTSSATAAVPSSVDQALPSDETDLPLDAAARSLLVAQVQKATPETIALAGEFADIVDDLTKNMETVNAATLKKPNDPSMGLMQLHHQTLLTYTTTLAFYFHLRSSPAYASDPTKLQSHPVLERLMKLKKGLSVMEDYGFGAGEEEEQQEDDEDEDEDEDEEDGDLDMDLNNIKAAPITEGSEDGSESVGSLEDDELMQLAAEEKENAKPKVKAKQLPQQKQKKSDGKKNDSSKKNAAPTERKAKAKKSVARSTAAPLAELADLGEHELVGDLVTSLSSNGGGSKKKRASKRTITDEEAFDGLGEPTTLSNSDSLDKEARKKSLRFHTNQIDMRDARRKQQLGGPSVGGDTDIPYRDRERSRMAVQQAAANRAARENANRDGMDLDGGDWGEADQRDWRDVMGVNEGKNGGASSNGRGNGDGDDDGAADYYDLVVSGKRAAKKQKKEEHDTAKLALRDELTSEGEAGDHRGINRAIEKNRGLTPRRNKASRNPRVKKRQKYDQAQKKLSSTRPVFKGGQASLQGGYSGEASGISSNVVKSRKFAG